MSQTVLLVDDAKYMRAALRYILAPTGVTVIEADDGVKAVAMATQGGIDLIVMDWDMPLMNGPDAARAIRAAGLDIPIIAFTGHDQPEEIAICLGAGMNGHISKGADMDVIVDQLVAALAMGNMMCPRSR